MNGIVTHVGMRSSKITTADESVYTIPNSMLTNTTVCNVNRSMVCVGYAMLKTAADASNM